MKTISLYIHIPFCESKCIYCDFQSFNGMDHKVESYVHALKKEIRFYQTPLRDYRVKTIFIGGGTPSSIDHGYIEELVLELDRNFDLSQLEEFTIEVNPGSLTREKIDSYRSLGINRVSMGAQSFDDGLLRKIGRVHNSEDIYNSVQLLREGGFTNINLDLMFGLPGQSLDLALDSIKKAIDLDIEHISHYSLILEEETPLYRSYLNGEIELMDEILDREIYHRSRKFLMDRGYKHYEISNYAKKNYESRHNLAYWEIDEYIGLGLASHSNFKNYRFSNSLNLDGYIDSLNSGNLAIVSRENIDKKEEIVEYCIMGFRKIDGINKEDFRKRFNVDIRDIYIKEIEKNLSNGLLLEKNDRIFLSEKGLDLANLVELDFFR